LINKETLKLILSHDVVFNEETTSNTKKGKGLPQKELEQIFPYIEEHKFDLDQNISLENVLPLEIIEKQMNPSWVFDSLQ
jgi:hypothetical protein